MPSVIKMILKKLPSQVEFEGVVFHLDILKNATDEMRLCYAISYVQEGSPHKADIDTNGTFENRLLGGTKNFLYLQENINTGKKMKSAIKRCQLFLITNKLIEEPKEDNNKQEYSYRFDWEDVSIGIKWVLKAIAVAIVLFVLYYVQRDK